MVGPRLGPIPLKPCVTSTRIVPFRVHKGYRGCEPAFLAGYTATIQVGHLTSLAGWNWWYSYLNLPCVSAFVKIEDQPCCAG